MTFLTEIQNNSIESGCLVIVRPRRRITSWTNVSGTTYSTPFTLGYVYSVKSDSTELTLQSSSSLSSGQYYYDHEAKTLYVNIGSDPNSSSKFLVVTYEIYISDKDINWHRIPTDTTSQVVFYSGDLRSKPVIKADMSETLFGYTPIQSSGIEILNQEYFWNEHVDLSSFYRADIEIYGYVGRIDNEDISKLYVGLIGNVNFRNDVISLQMLDRIARFSDGFDGAFYAAQESGTVLSAYLSSGFIGTLATDPNYIGRAKTIVFGAVDGVRAVNLGYSETINDKNNRVWAVAHGKTRINGGTGYNINRAIPVHPSFLGSNTTTRTWLTSTNGISVGDRVLFGGISLGPPNVRRRVDAVGVNFIDHDPIPTPLSSVGDFVYISNISRVQVFMDGELYDLTAWTPFRDVGLSFIVLDDNYATTDSLPRYIGPNDTVFCRVYGDDELPTIGGVTFGELNNEYLCITSVVLVIYKIMRDYLGIPEEEINTQSFQAAYGTGLAYDVSFRAPRSLGSEYPTYIDILTELLTTGLFRLYLNEEHKWTLESIKAQDAPDWFATDDEYRQGSIEHEYNYDDILSDVIVEYGYREVSENPHDKEGISYNVYQSNPIAKYVHNISRQRMFRTALTSENDAENLALRLAAIFGDRRCLLRLNLKPAFFNIHPGSVLQVTSEKLAGYPVASGTNRTRTYVVTSVEKTLGEVHVVADDQKGIEDNPSLF